MSGKQRIKSKEHTETGIGIRFSTIWKNLIHPQTIYPENKYIGCWDALMLSLIFIYAFTVPYQLGVSGGIHLLKSVAWFVVTVCMNTCFFIDTFLYFFRAYRDSSGRMVIEPKAIRRNYLKTLFLPNLLSNLPTTIVFYAYGHTVLIPANQDTDDVYENGNSALLVLLKLADLLKLLRLGRAQRLLSTSEFVREFREKRKAYTLQMWVFVFLIVMAAHWFACIWSFVAFLQVGSYTEDDLLNEDNWIGHWYTTSFIEGGLNPLGWYNDTNRYVLSLFWAIQTITSIGYGNIVPFTPLEWWVGSILQLMAGILWAYIIGGLVGVVTAMEVKNEIFRGRIDQANELISVFMPEEKEKTRGKKHIDEGDKDEITVAEKKAVAKRIRRYIYTQAERPRSNFRCVSNMEQAFPVLESLSPELKLSSSLMLMKKYLNKIPYLSSNCLSSGDQGLVAQQCLAMEFPSGETVDMEEGVAGYGRGILVQIKGLASRSSRLKQSIAIVHDGVFGDGAILLEDGRQGTKWRVTFMSYSVVAFVPREAVLSALARSTPAWTSARWKCFGSCLAEKAIVRLDENEKRSELKSKA